MPSNETAIFLFFLLRTHSGEMRVGARASQMLFVLSELNAMKRGAPWETIKSAAEK